MGKCFSKKQSVKKTPLLPSSPAKPSPNARFSQPEPLTHRTPQSDTVQSLRLELQQCLVLDPSPLQKPPPNPLHSEPVLGSSERPLLAKRASLDLNEILLQGPNEEMAEPKSAGGVIRGWERERKLQALNNINDFLESRRFLTATYEFTSFTVNPLDRIEHEPCLRKKTNLTLIEMVKKTDFTEKWLCLYEHETLSQTSQVFLQVYREDPFNLRKELLRKLKEVPSEYVTQLFETFTVRNRDYQWREGVVETVVYEHSRGDLRQLIDKRQVMKVPYTNEEALYFVERGLLALKALKTAGIAHLGLTTDSFHYVDENYKLAGLGEAFLYEENEETKKQKLILLENDRKNYRFMAPELFTVLLGYQPKPVDDPFKCDIYSLGIVLLDLIRCEPTPSEYCHPDYIQKLFDSLAKRHSVIVYLLGLMLAAEPNNRADVDRLLKELEGNAKQAIDEHRYLTKPKKFQNLKKALLVNEAIFGKNYLSKEETYVKIQEFMEKGIVLFNLEQYHTAAEQLSLCLRFERFPGILSDDEVFSIYLHLGLSYLRRDLALDARNIWLQAERWVKDDSRAGVHITDDLMVSGVLLEKSQSIIQRNLSLNSDQANSFNIINSAMFTSKKLNLQSSSQDFGRDYSQRNEIDPTKINSLWYYLALSCYRLADYENAKSYLAEIWSQLNLRTLPVNDFLCDYFELCGLTYSLVGKHSLSSKCFQIFREKSEDSVRCLSLQAKLELLSGNYLESYCLFQELLNLLDSKEFTKVTDKPLLETLGHLLQLSELLQDKREFFYILSRIQSRFKEMTQELEDTPRGLGQILDWLLRFSAYFRLFDEEFGYFVRIILADIRERVREYPEKTFLVYAQYCLGKGCYYAESKDEAIEAFTVAWAETLALGARKPSFQNSLATQCGVDSLVWLSELVRDEKQLEQLDEQCDGLIAQHPVDFGFKLYFRTRRSVLQACGKPEEQVEGLKKAEALLLEDAGFGHFRELGLLYEQKMLALLREDKAQEAREVIEGLMSNWLIWDREHRKGKSEVMIDDYKELRQVTMEESARFLVEVCWLFQRLAFQFLRHGYLHNARLLLIRIKSYLFKQGLVWQAKVKQGETRLPQLSEEHVLDLYNLLSTVCYQLDDLKEGLEYLLKAYELVERLWTEDLQKQRFKGLLIGLTFQVSQAYQLQGHPQRAISLLESRRLVFESERPETQVAYKSLLLLLKAKVWDFEAVMEGMGPLAGVLGARYEKTKEPQVLTRILRVETLRVDVLLAKGALEDAEKALLLLIQRVNKIIKEGGEDKEAIERDWEFQREYQIVIGEYFAFTLEYSKAEPHLTKAFELAKGKFGSESYLAVEANNPLVECLVREMRFQEAEQVFRECQGADLKGIGVLGRQRVEGLLLISLGRYSEALKVIEGSGRDLERFFINEKKPSNFGVWKAELSFLKGKALFFKGMKDESEEAMNEVFKVVEQEIKLKGTRGPIIIEMLLEIAKERLKRFKIVEYLQIIKDLPGFLPDEKSKLVELLGEKACEIDLLRIFERFEREKDEENLRKGLLIILKNNIGLLNGGERKKYRKYLMNRREEVVETKEIIRLANVMSLGLYKRYKGHRMILEAQKLSRISEQL